MRFLGLLGEAKEELFSLIDDLLSPRLLLLSIPALYHLIRALLAFHSLRSSFHICLLLLFLFRILILGVGRFLQSLILTECPFLLAYRKASLIFPRFIHSFYLIFLKLLGRLCQFLRDLFQGFDFVQLPHAITIEVDLEIVIVLQVHLGFFYLG